MNNKYISPVVAVEAIEKESRILTSSSNPAINNTPLGNMARNMIPEKKAMV